MSYVSHGILIDTTNLPIRQSTDAYVFKYDRPAELAKEQRAIIWIPEEIAVENDKNDFLFNMTPQEQEAVKITLKLFTKYEVLLNEAWGSKIYHWFPRPECQMAASTFAFMEASVHAVFYNDLNKVLGIDTEDFHLSYKNDPILSERINSINEAIASDDVMMSIAAFTLLENCVLYSNFAYLLHYQANGKNKINNVASGIKFSCNDEAIHAIAAAWLFNTCLEEWRETVSEDHYQKTVVKLNEQIKLLADDLYEHEVRIVDMLFENGPIDGINAGDLKTFVRERIAVTLRNLGVDSSDYEVEENPIGLWFYNTVSGISLHDFFSKQGNSYRRDVEVGEFEF